MRVRTDYCESEFCGWDGVEPHLCHRCHLVPGTVKFYCPTMKFALAGMQPKFSMRKTLACEECWAAFQILLKDAHAREAAGG